MSPAFPLDLRQQIKAGDPRFFCVDTNILDSGLKQALNARLETRADEGAVRILSEIERDIGSVGLYLEVFLKNGKVKDAEGRIRMTARTQQ